MSFTVQSTLNKYYNQITELFCTDQLAHNAEFEILPVLFVLSDFAAATSHKDRNAIANEFYAWAKQRKLLTEFNFDTFDERIDLYGKAIRGMKLRGYWTPSEIDSYSKNAITKCAAVFGDILVCPACADNYENAPWFILDFFKLIPFGTKMNQAIEKLGLFFKEISSVSQNPTAPTSAIPHTTPVKPASAVPTRPEIKAKPAHQNKIINPPQQTSPSKFKKWVIACIIALLIPGNILCIMYASGKLPTQATQYNYTTTVKTEPSAVESEPPIFSEYPIVDIENKYVLNSYNKKIHLTSCLIAKRILPENQVYLTDEYTLADAIHDGYTCCDRCLP